MTQVTVRVDYRELYNGARDERRHQVELRAEGDENFVAVLEAQTSVSDYNRTYCAFLGADDLPHDAIALVDQDITMAEVAGWAGNETLRLDNAGRGGGAEPGITLFEVISHGLAVAKVISMTYAGYLATLRLKFAEHAREARAWDDTDVISPRLEHLVKAERYWTRRDYDLAFRLERHRGSTLLKMLGYRQVTQGANEFWEEIDPDNPTPRPVG